MQLIEKLLSKLLKKRWKEAAEKRWCQRYPGFSTVETKKAKAEANKRKHAAAKDAIMQRLKQKLTQRKKCESYQVNRKSSRIPERERRLVWKYIADALNASILKFYAEKETLQRRCAHRLTSSFMLKRLYGRSKRSKIVSSFNPLGRLIDVEGFSLDWLQL